MIYTYKKSKQVNWKPNNRNLIVAKNSRPNYNGNLEGVDPNEFQSKFSTPRPLKQYRKQIIPFFNNKSKQVSIDNVMGPNGSFYSKSNEIINGCYNNTEDLNVLTEYILDKPKPCLGNKKNNECVGGNTNVYFRRANTNLNKNYYQTSKAYLYSKCKTYDQKNILGNNIDENSYKMSKCDLELCNKTIYKPNNTKFATQGSVTSSTRLLRLKNDTITKNGASFRSAFGSQSANAGTYKNSISGENIYFDKNKYSNVENCSITNQYPQNFRKYRNTKTNCTD